MSWQPKEPPFVDFKKNVFKKAGMVTGFIYQIGEYEALREPSQEVSLDKVTSPEFKAKFKYLKEILLKYRELTGYGRGITAVQIGIPERFSVIFTSDNLLIVVNPTITKKSKKQLLYPEICMSANPIIAPTVRPAWIEFDYYDEHGKLQHWKTKDLTENGRMLNRVFQHEIDHMDGVINIDKVRNPKELILESNPEYYDTAKFEEIK